MNALYAFFVSGGFFMWPLLALSVIGGALVVERCAAAVGMWTHVLASIEFLRSGGKSIGRTFGGIDKNVFLSGKEHAEKTVKAGFEIVFERFLGKLEILSSIGNIAPLIGFIGTVSGMISSFSAIAGADRVSVKLIAGGISEALITTLFGLIIAIPCVLTEQFLRQAMRVLACRVEDGLGNDWFESAILRAGEAE